MHVPRASVNAFGYGGANAHCILEPGWAHTPHAAPSPSPLIVDDSVPCLLPFSASCKEALRSRVNDTRLILDMRTDLIADVADVLTGHRSRLGERGYLLARQNTMLEDLHFENLTLAPTGSAQGLPYAFVFTGQGAQWAGMGRDLVQHSDIFRACIQDLDDHLSTLSPPPSWTLQGQCKTLYSRYMS